MARPAPGTRRPLTAPDGSVWEAGPVKSGRASPYLAPRLTRPLVEFRCVTAPDRARRYAVLDAPSLDDLAPEALVALWDRARPH